MSTDTRVSVAEWGSTREGEKVQLFTLANAFAEVQLATFGARVVRVLTKDKDGAFGDIALGADVLDPYLNEPNFYLGCTVGRFANRIAHGTFSIEGREYKVPLNNGTAALHGGPVGYDLKVWAAREVPDGVEFSYTSPDGEMGFPGTLRVIVNYTLVDNGLRIDYSATTDATTIVNLTNHTYWNLAGRPESIGGHRIMIPADRYTPTDGAQVPTGEIASVEGTPLDLRKEKAISEGWDAEFAQIQGALGYDHNFILNGAEAGQLNLAGRVSEPVSGRTLSVYTTEPAVQFYSGNFLDGRFPGRYAALNKRAGFCLEPQHYPDAPNHADFPSTLLRPEETYRSTTVFVFNE